MSEQQCVGLVLFAVIGIAMFLLIVFGTIEVAKIEKERSKWL